jgi:hypothetical protein
VCYKVRRINSLEVQCSEELNEPRQFMIAWLVRDSLESSSVCPRYIDAMSRGCYT